VVDEEFARSTPKFARLLADLAPASLGLNATGGAAAATVLKALGPGATFTTYGSMSGQPVRVPTDAFTVRGIKLGGFSLDGTLAGMAKGARDAAVREAVADVSGGEGKAKVSQLLAREPFLDFPHALARAMRSSERKVVLTMPAAK
jgi:NADPH:quinone reductase-like Zn-dependent oxidoreductase